LRRLEILEVVRGMLLPAVATSCRLALRLMDEPDRALR